MRGGRSTPSSGPFNPWRKPCAHCTEDCVNPKGWSWWMWRREYPLPFHRDSNPETSSLYSLQRVINICFLISVNCLGTVLSWLHDMYLQSHYKIKQVLLYLFWTRQTDRQMERVSLRSSNTTQILTIESRFDGLCERRVCPYNNFSLLQITGEFLSDSSSWKSFYSHIKQCRCMQDNAFPVMKNRSPPF